jgi:hypothetical protein
MTNDFHDTLVWLSRAEPDGSEGDRPPQGMPIVSPSKINSEFVQQSTARLTINPYNLDRTRKQ